MEINWKYYNDIKAIMKSINSYETIVIYDVETTGLSKKKDRIIQFSAIRYQVSSWKEIDRIDLYIKSPFAINGTAASEANGITDELLEEKGISEKEAFEQIKEFMSLKDCICGYNNQRFDDGMMAELYTRHKDTFGFACNVDIYKFVQMIVPPEHVMVEMVTVKNGKEKKEKKASYKLKNVTDFYSPGNTIKFHSSINDVEATAFVFQKTMEDAKKMIMEYEEKEELRKDIPRQSANIKSISLFNPSQRLKRVYINTDQGTIYYDEISHKWAASKKGVINSIDMDKIVADVFKMLDISEENELYKKVQWEDKMKHARALFNWENVCYSEESLKVKKDEMISKVDLSDEKKGNEEIKTIQSYYNALKREYFGKNKDIA